MELIDNSTRLETNLYVPESLKYEYIRQFISSAVMHNGGVSMRVQGECKVEDVVCVRLVSVSGDQYLRHRAILILIDRELPE